MTKERNLSVGIAVYELSAGGALLVVGAVQGSWWTSAVGALLAVAGGLTAFGRGEATSWFRGELDERRQRAVDHSFFVAFVTLAWWVAGVTVVAESRDVPVELWSAGILVALVAAYVDYARVLRRT
jgi:hypothetical protein